MSHDQSHGMSSGDHTASAWKLFFSNASAVQELTLPAIGQPLISGGAAANPLFASNFNFNNTNTRFGIGSSSANHLLELDDVGATKAFCTVAFKNDGVSKGQLGVATAAMSILSATGLDDTAIRAENNLLFGTNGDNLRMKIDTAGLITIPGTLEVGTVQTYSETNVVTDRAYDANSTTLAELADVIGTLIADLRVMGLVN